MLRQGTSGHLCAPGAGGSLGPDGLLQRCSSCGNSSVTLSAGQGPYSEKAYCGACWGGWDASQAGSPKTFEELNPGLAPQQMERSEIQEQTKSADPGAPVGGAAQPLPGEKTIVATLRQPGRPAGRRLDRWVGRAAGSGGKQLQLEQKFILKFT